MTNQKQKSKLFPFAAGLFVLILLAGFSLGLRTVIEVDPASAQVRTTKYIFLHLPISSETHPTWISPGRPDSPDWQLMHEFHHSAAGSDIQHTHWGAIVDSLQSWEELRFDIQAKDTLSANTLSLINTDTNPKALRVYLLRINAQLNYLLTQPEGDLTPEIINTLMSEVMIEPIDREASKFPDP
jgi:hypothetical protein